MSTNTTYMSLKKSQTTDNSTTYLDTDLAGSLDTIDSHDHSTNAKGLAVGRIQTSSTPTVSGGVQVDTTNKDLVIYDGTAARTIRAGVWTDFTPSVTRGAAVTHTVTYARYTIIGKLAIVQIQLVLTTNGTASNALVVTSIPSAIQPKQTGNGAVAGTAAYLTSGSGWYSLAAETTTTTTLQFYGYGVTQYFGVAPNFVNGGSDPLGISLAYEIA